MASASSLLRWNPPFTHTRRRQNRTTLFCSKPPQGESILFRFQIAVKYKQSDSGPCQNPFDRIKKTLDSLKKPAVAAVLLGLLLFYDPNSALAASGGRIGGNSFSSRRSSSSSSSSYSVPRTFDQSSSTRYSAPYYGPSPFSGGLYVGPAVGFGFGGGFSSFSPILVGLAAFIVVSGFLSDRRSQGSTLTATQKTSVIKLQVGLLGLGRTLQQDFNRLAENADTSTSEGLAYVLTEATLALLRHPDYCISCYSSVDVRRSIEDGEKRFNQLSIEERGKFDEETLVNVNSIKRQSSKIRTASGFSNEYIVVTILVAAEGTHKLQPINGTADMKEALQKIGSIPRNKIMAVEVLWTPQNEKDTLSERKLLEDYPLLRPL
ncbi:hypothetical protein HID58_042000 [Brassica napus]|uniref:BnaC01g20270D protein n=2 Tax=Brassica napus TaxID=3708 RepID=A0A078G195_BRANA|nr:uncharacterized protein LOC111212738 [Brassica napus]KAH0902497.1 hypothetical protein HID58_042000 [Brassica napus]CAF2072364.1 unnamed protein product [Brassica napus]CDY19041.1 BnaC01g20270D [Brassica napus]